MEHCCYQDLPNSHPLNKVDIILVKLVARSLLSAWTNSYDQADSENEGSVGRI